LYSQPNKGNVPYIDKGYEIFPIRFAVLTMLVDQLVEFDQVCRPSFLPLDAIVPVFNEVAIMDQKCINYKV
jgi:hypothetical protein